MKPNFKFINPEDLGCEPNTGKVFIETDIDSFNCLVSELCWAELCTSIKEDGTLIEPLVESLLTLQHEICIYKASCE